MHTDMTRVNAIWQHPLYQQNLKDLIHLEAERQTVYGWYLA